MLNAVVDRAVIMEQEVEGASWESGPVEVVHLASCSQAILKSLLFTRPLETLTSSSIRALHWTDGTDLTVTRKTVLLFAGFASARCSTSARTTSEVLDISMSPQKVGL